MLLKGWFPLLETLKLLLPIFFPSWQFFKEIVPSPRIEFSLSSGVAEEASKWQDFCFRAERLSAIRLLKTVFFNARWNEWLYIMNCAEQLIINPTEYSSQEIMRRIEAELERRGVDLTPCPYLQFRLVFVSRQGSKLQEEILFVSKPERVSNHEF